MAIHAGQTGLEVLGIVPARQGILLVALQALLRP